MFLFFWVGTDTGVKSIGNELSNLVINVCSGIDLLVMKLLQHCVGSPHLLLSFVFCYLVNVHSS